MSKVIPILLVLILKTLALKEECSKKYTCTNELGGQSICSNKIDDIIYLKQCDIYYHCSFTSDNSYCYKSQYEYESPSYPGGSCNDNSECLSNNCKNGKCERRTSTIYSSEDCEFGNFYNTTEKICQFAKNKGESCEKDEECKNNLACFKGICIEFFSLPINTYIGTKSPFLCENGYALNNYCVNLKLINNKCDNNDICKYLLSNDSIIELYDKCDCTYSLNPEKKCQYGNLDLPIWKNYTDLIKETLKEDNIKKCNVIEKRPGYCRETLKQSWTAKNANVSIKKYKSLFEGYHTYTNDAPCAINVVNSIDFSPPKPKNGIFSCPAYHCGSDVMPFDNKTCAYSTNPFNEKGENVSVYLQNICGKGHYCNYKKEFPYLDYTYNSTCLETPTSKTWTIKYAGEKCTTKNQCRKSKSFPDVGYCIDGYCSGHIEGQNCTLNSDCHKGHFCNGLYCEKQKGEGKFCLNSYECLNYLGCLNNTCVQYFSMDNGTYLNASDPEIELCQMGMMNSDTHQCAQLAYTDEMDRIKNKDGFVPCEVGKKCNYTTGYYSKGSLVIIQTECVCGFNKDGKSFCPLPHTVNVDDWKKYFKLKNKQKDNSCHTVRRNDCNDEMSDSDLNDLRYYQRKTERAHLFYGSSNCIIEILNSGFIKANIILLIVLFYLYN